MSRTPQTVAPALQAYFRETSEAAIQAAMPQAAPATAPPWTGRRLQHALAEIGPARPSFEMADPISARLASPAATVEASRPLPLSSRPAQGLEADFQHAPETGYDLPPAVASLIAALPVQSPPLGPHEIVSALAGTGPDPTTAHVMARFLPEPMPLETIERPPMMIERALAERELRAGAALAIPARQNPWPALAAGFASALATGVALYAVLVLR